MSDLKDSPQRFLRPNPRETAGPSSLRAPSPSGSATTVDDSQSISSDQTGHESSGSISSLEDPKPPATHPSHPQSSSVNDPPTATTSNQAPDGSNDISGQCDPTLDLKGPGDGSQSAKEDAPTIPDHSKPLGGALGAGGGASSGVNANKDPPSASDTNRDLNGTQDFSQDSSPPTTSPSSSEAQNELDDAVDEKLSLAADHGVSQKPDPAADSDISDGVEPPTVKPEADDEIDPKPGNRFKNKESPAKQEWGLLKARGVQNKEIDELMDMVGLESVKRQFLAIRAKVEVCKRQKTDINNERFNIIFQGNPGTGKTTVARLYARFLHTCGIIKSGFFKETSGATLAYKGARGVKNKIKKMMLNHGGGVLFVDEAYQLTADHSPVQGRQVLDVLLTMMENNIGKLVVIFVGYNNEMQSFWEHNPGLASRIPYTLQFDDFDDIELWTILRDIIIKKYDSKMKITGGMEGLFVRIAIRRLGYGRGFKGFGNARAVHVLLSKISERQARRLAKEELSNGPDSLDYLRFTKEDLIGPKPKEVLKDSAARIQLESLIGLQQVKETTRNMIEIISTNYLRELKEMSPLNFSLNRVFYGSPGTGKTTVAKLYGKIMAELGLLSNGEVVVKNPSDFIGQCLGKSEAKTRAILKSTEGKVLVIDEAYMLNHGGTDGDSKGDSYKMAVVDTLVAEVQSVPGDDRCILILGYEDKLKTMFHNVNPGLSRRFAIEDPFRFEDFDLPQLKEILKLKMVQEHLTATDDAMDIALGVLDRARMRPNFSNAGEVDNLLAKAKLNYQARQMKEPDPQKRAYDANFVPADFDPDHKRSANAGSNCRNNLQGLVDDSIITRLEGYQTLATAIKNAGLDPRTEIPTKFIFKGPPGTGKTTSARKMGKVFYDMGFLSTDEVVECSASDLIGQYMGHTGPKTRAYLEKALGKVLFIDEAYRLTEGQYATEAVNELITHLTNPRYSQKIIVILAGYSLDMNWLMRVRPALSALFPEEIIFDNIKPEACIALLLREMEQRKVSAPFLKTPDGVDYNELLNLMRMLALLPSWSNARDIKTLAKGMAGHCFKERPAGITTSKPILSPELAKACTKKMINMLYHRSLMGVEAGSEQGRPICFPQETQAPCSSRNCEASPPPAHGTDQETAPASATNALQQTTPELESHGAIEQGDNTPDLTTDGICLRPLNHDGTPRETAVSDRIWNQLQKDKKAEAIAKLKRGEKERKKEAKIQKVLQQSGGCENGYEWIPQGDGYRCAGGFHFVSRTALAAQMG